MDMQQQFRAVPDGQYTQTIYSLIRDQKYMEVSLIRYDIIIFSVFPGNLFRSAHLNLLFTFR